MKPEPEAFTTATWADNTKLFNYAGTLARDASTLARGAGTPACDKGLCPLTRFLKKDRRACSVPPNKLTILVSCNKVLKFKIKNSRAKKCLSPPNKVADLDRFVFLFNRLDAKNLFAITEQGTQSLDQIRFFSFKINALCRLLETA